MLTYNLKHMFERSEIGLCENKKSFQLRNLYNYVVMTVIRLNVIAIFNCNLLCNNVASCDKMYLCIFMDTYVYIHEKENNFLIIKLIFGDLNSDNYRC